MGTQWMIASFIIMEGVFLPPHQEKICINFKAEKQKYFQLNWNVIRLIKIRALRVRKVNIETKKQECERKFVRERSILVSIYFHLAKISAVQLTNMYCVRCFSDYSLFSLVIKTPERLWPWRKRKGHLLIVCNMIKWMK